MCVFRFSGNGEVQWCFSQVKGTLDDDVTEADIISCVEFNHDGELLATGDKGGRVVIFQRDPLSKTALPRRGEYNVYSTFQSHEPEFDYLKSLEIEEKINKIRWLRRRNQSHFLLSTNDKTIKLWKVSERDKRVEGYNTRLDNGSLRDPACVQQLRVPTIKPMELMVEASPRRIFANAHTYHINSISVNSDQETYLSADDLRINLWHLEITDQSFNIVDIKPQNMEELTEVITAAEFHPVECNLFVYSSSKGTIRLCDMRQAALCDRHAKLFEEPEDPTNRSFFSEIISSISDVKLSNSGRYMISRDYLSVKVWDLHMETKPIETYPVSMERLIIALSLINSSLSGTRVPALQAVLAIRERLHIRQVRMLLERQRLGHHDGLLQQLLPDVRAGHQARGDAGGVARHRQAQDGPQAAQGVHGRQTQKGRDQRRLPRLQQEDPAHGVASLREHHCRRRHQQPVPLPGQVLAGLLRSRTF